ncbi:MAG TPA: HAMP domain-containing sensor histidine kinase [Candidatus Sulfotelmatobacter sp.]|jgi:signal transduction histidine kinase|nr:HAMP domain-containing sensor histidine kinase [Candidatus Sulfotelmatobacter sp.]
MLLITAALTTTSLLLVQRSIRSNVRQSIAINLRNSVAAFQDFRHERETMLTSDVALLADLPITRAIMTSPDPVTIQDASQSVWQIADNDLFVLVDRGGHVVALHTKTPGFARDAAEKYFQQSLDEDRGESSHWWLGEHHLYQTFIEPIYRGSKTDGTLLGFLVIGYEINDRLAEKVSKVAGSQVAFSCGSEIVGTTLMPPQVQTGSIQNLIAGSVQDGPHDIEIGDERFLATSLVLSGSRSTLVRLNVLSSYDQATKFVDQLNRYLLLLGLAAIVIGSGLVFFVSHTFTRPLGNLVGGVRALGGGDFHHPLDPHGGDEVAELTRAFDRMRVSLLKSQRDLLESEQLATIGRMASSISHDLRHSLAAIVANSEFLCDSHLTPAQREELYQEVRTGVNLMTDLIDSLLEFARTRESLNPAYGNVSDTIHRAAQAARLHPRHHARTIDVLCSNQVSGWYDARKLERALYNLLLNACEAAPGAGGEVEVTAAEIGGAITISVCDNGPGIADSIRDRLFHPFVSYGKENGTGLGLAVVQKIVQDHNGEISVERTAHGRTVFKIVLPGRLQESFRGANDLGAGVPSLVPAQRDEASQSSISHPAP